MKGTGIFVTEEELENLNIQIKCSGMFLSGGAPMGNPQKYVYDLTQKYNPPSGAGLNPKTGEFMLP